MEAEMASSDAKHLTSPTLLRKIDELREKNVGQHVPLPQLVVVGDQSSGKSSVLESLTNIPFPRDLELCTRYATQITSRRESVLNVKVAIIPGPHATDDHRRQLDGYCPVLESMEKLRAEFPQILEQVNVRVGIKSDTSSGQGSVFSEDVLKIEVCGPHEDYLTVIDIPGIFRTPTEGITTRDDIKLVQNMVKEYTKKPRTIILAVLPSNVDTATQEILEFAKEYDPSGERTLGVLTKPDLVKETSAKLSVCNLVLGKRQPLTLGYHVVRNRGPDDGIDFNYALEEQRFRDEPWNDLPRDRVGVLSLKTRLSELLGEITRKEFPKLRAEVQKELDQSHRSLERLGPARRTEQEQRVYISNLARKFQSIVEAALNAHYYAHTAFDDTNGLRLITHVVNLTDLFSKNFERKAHTRIFEDSASEAPVHEEEAPSQEEDSDNEKEGPDDEADDQDDEIDDAGFLKEGTRALRDALRKDTFLADLKREEFAMLNNLVSKSFLLEEPEKGIMAWTEDLYLRSRSVDLGTFGGTVLSSAFKEQSTKWLGITKVYIGQIVYVVHRFMVTLLKVLCADERMLDDIWSSVHDEVLKIHTLAMDQAISLVGIERDKRPYTLNHYFNENLQHARNRRKVKELRRKARREYVYNQSAKTASAKEIIVLDSIKEVTTKKSNVEHVKEEIHDILRSYYKVARKRFVDNIYLQVVDHCLLTGPMSPLGVFNQEWAIMLSAEQLESIVGESPTTKARREALLKKIDDLQVAMQILRR